MPARNAASPDDIEMSSVVSSLKKSLPKILATSAALGLLTFGALSLVAPVYQSEAQLAITAKGASSFTDPKAAPGNPESITTRMDTAAINTHVRALQSPDLIDKIAADLNLNQKPEFNAELGPVDTMGRVLGMIGLGGPRAGETERDRVLGAFRNRLDVYSAKESRFIGIRMSATDPQLAADIANVLAEDYRASLASQGIGEVDDQQQVLQGKIDKLAPELTAAETEIDRYRGEINAFVGGAQKTGLDDQALAELNTELQKAKATRGEAEARAKSAREMMKLGSADALPDVQKSPLIQNLVQQRVRLERQISELSATLLPGHPRMRQLNADLGGLKQQLNGEIAKLVDSLDKEAKVSAGREESIKKSLDAQKQTVVKKAPDEAKLRSLEASAKAKRSELENLQGQLEANRKKLDVKAQPVEAQLISKAQPASVPIFPKKIPLTGLVAAASMMLGLAWTITKSLFQGARGGAAAFPARAAPLPRGVAEPAMATAGPSILSRLDRKSAAVDNIATVDIAPVGSTPASLADTSVAGVSKRLAAKRGEGGGHRTLIAGETMSVNATAEAIELTKLIADTGAQVVLVDWSPSGRGISKDVGVTAATGLTELLCGDVSFEAIVERVPGTRAHFIPCGAPLDSAPVDIGPDQLNLVLDALDEAYDHIIVVGPHEDARFLFEAIQGRFDTGIVVAEAKQRQAVLSDPPGTFLGFEVTDIDIDRIERKPATSGIAQRIVRATTKPGSDAHPM